MDDNTKLAAALIAGYVLGRTKKGKAAIRLALWASGKGSKLQPQALAREGATRLTQTPELAQLAEQLRGPLAAAAQKAVIATLEAQINAVADNLQKRTQSLQAVTGAAQGTAGQATGAAGEAAGQATEAVEEATEAVSGLTSRVTGGEGQTQEKEKEQGSGSDQAGDGQQGQEGQPAEQPADREPASQS
jgi:hypothetical protein